MKVYFSKYRNHWYSPYTWFDYVFFWTDWSRCSRDKSIQSAIDEAEGRYHYVEHPAWVDRWSDRLVWISRAIQWVLDRIHPEVRYVRIDPWDTWSMDSTLSPIILPMLRQLQASKHGAPFVDDEDVPEHLRSTAAPPRENEWDTDDNHFARWDWIMSEMIWTFEQLQPGADWEHQYYSGEHDTLWVPVDGQGNEVAKGEHKFYEMRPGPNDTFKIDKEGMAAHDARIENGLRLFGKYYRGLWD